MRLAPAIVVCLASSAALGRVVPQTSPSSVLPQGRAAAVGRFVRELGPGVALRGEPSSVFGDGAADGFVVSGRMRIAGALPDRERADEAARALFAREPGLFGLDSGELALRQVLQLAGTWYLEYEARRAGLALRESRVELRISREGELTQLAARGMWSGDFDPTFAVEERDALELARLALAGVRSERIAAGPAVRAAQLRASARTAGASQLVPVWTVELHELGRADASFVAVLDGRTGELLALEHAVVPAISGTVSGRGVDGGPQPSVAPTSAGLENLRVQALDALTAFAQLTSNACPDEQATISGDGTRIAFISRCDGDGELWTMLADGSGLLRLSDNAFEERAPAISFDGSRIAFVSNRDGDDEIFAIQTDGTGLVQLTSNSARDDSPSLAADGSLVVYVSFADGDPEICRVSSAGGAPTQLTSNATLDLEPALSADATKIAWAGEVGGDLEILVMNADGSGVTQLTSNSVEDREPALAPDGSRVCFVSRLPIESAAAGDPSSAPARVGNRARARAPALADEPFDLFEVQIASGSTRRLTHGPGNEREPRYAADGGCVACASDEGGDFEIWLYDLATGSGMQLTDNASDDRRPQPASSCASGAWTSNDGDREVSRWNLASPGAFAAGYSSAGGAYSLPLADGHSASVTAQLAGRFARVVDLAPDSNELRASGGATTPASGVDLAFNALGSAELPTAQVSAYRHTERAHAFLESVLHRPPLAVPGTLAIDQPLLARVNAGGLVPNAFYNLLRGDTTYFAGAGASRPNTAYDTVIYHEYGHFADHRFGGIGAGSSCEAVFALSEGFADVLALYASAQGRVGEDFFGPGTWIRNYDLPVSALPVHGSATRQYDAADAPHVSGLPEVHAHGEAFAGFAWDLRAAVGAATAENLLFGALAVNPHDMPSAVRAVFELAATPAFGGTGIPATSPLYGPICTAAARHGFDCAERADRASHGCLYSICTSLPAIHRAIGTEWLGNLVDSEPACELVPNFDDDGVVVPPTIASGTFAPITITLRVDPALRFSGRYGGAVAGLPIRQRYVYVNAWLFVVGPGGGVTEYKILGTDPTSTVPDASGFPPDTLAFNPDSWSGSSFVYSTTFEVPPVSTPLLTILRVRVDYGEDAGIVDGCLSDPSLSQACGPARFGEVEEALELERSSRAPLARGNARSARDANRQRAFAIIQRAAASRSGAT